LPAGQGRAAGAVALRAGQATARVRRIELLQRLAQRPAAARACQPPGGGRPGRSPRPRGGTARLGTDFPSPVKSGPSMINRFIRRVLGLPSENMLRLPRDKHGLAREALSASAARVCAALREAGFSAYVVGGAVRDLLLGITPKDFDIATDARS